MEQTVCLLCGVQDERPLLRRATPRHVVCRRCGLVYQNPRPTPAEISAYYEKGYWEGRWQLEGDQPPINEASLERGRAVVDWIRPLVTPGDLVIDIGCGHGEILAHVRDELGTAALGVEPSRVQAASAVEQFGLSVQQTNLDGVSLNGRKANLLILSHVFEHFHDPRAALARCRELLVDDGWVFIEVPNVLHPHPRKRLTTLLPLEHMYTYSVGTLCRLMREAGFRVARSDSQTFVRILAQVAPQAEPAGNHSAPPENEYHRVLRALLRHDLEYWPRYAVHRATSLIGKSRERTAPSRGTIAAEVPSSVETPAPAKRSMSRKILGLLSDSATYGASTLIGQLISFVLLRLYTEYLGTVEYGIIGMLAIVVMLFSPLANLGMTNAIFRRYNLSKDVSVRRTVLGTGLSSIVACSLILLAILALASQPIANHVVGDPNTTDLVALSLLTAAIATIGGVPRVMLRADRRVRTVALLNVAQVLFTVLPTIWFVVFQEAGVRGVVLGNLIGEVLGAVTAFSCTWGSFKTGFDLPTWRVMLSYGLPFVPHQVQAVALALFGQYMVRELLGLDEAGLYNMATKFAMPVTLVVMAVQNSWVAYKFQIHAEDDDPPAFFRSTLTYYVAGMTYLWVGVSVWGPELVRFMTTAPFHDAAYLVWAVSLIPLAQGMYFMSGTGIELSNNTRPYPVVSLAGLLVVVAGAFWLVPQVGALGAALATVLGWIVMGCLMFYFAQRRLSIDYDWPTIFCFGLLASICVAFGGLAQGMALLPRVTCAMAISLAFPLAAVAFLVRSREERHRMQKLLTRAGLDWFQA